MNNSPDGINKFIYLDDYVRKCEEIVFKFNKLKWNFNENY